MDRIYKIYKDRNDLSIKGELLYTGELNFDGSHPIEAHPIYETELIKKVYWTDGKNQPRVINVEASTEDKAKWDNTTFDFVRDLNLSETVTIVKVPLGNGLFPAGTIQYAFSYFNKYRQLSNIFYTSPLYYNTFIDRAGGPDEVVSNSYNIQITTPDSRFDYVRVYSIIRTSLDGTPVVKRLIDLIINSTNDILKFTDNNTLGDIIDPMELLYIGGEPISVGTMISKDNTLFLGNINLKREEIGNLISLEIKLIGDTDPITILPKKLYTENSNNSNYNYKPQFNKSSLDNTTFKIGEVYRFGLYCQHESGKFSEAIWLQDKLITKPYNENNTKLNSVEFNETGVDIYGTKCLFVLNEDLANKLRSLGYTKIGGLVVYPSLHDRNVICLGVINPTLYNVGDRYTKSPYAISSWAFRPMVKQMYNYNFSKGVTLEWRHGYSLPSNNYRNSELQTCSTELNTFLGMLNGTNTNPLDVDFVSRYSNDFFIDQSIQTFHSPDIEFDESLNQIDDLNNLKLKIIGLVALTGFESNSNLTTSTGVRQSGNAGWIKPNINTFNYDNVYGANVFGSYHSFNDDDGYYTVYPWNSIRSLNSVGPSDSRSAMLAKKNMFNYRYSGYNIYVNDVILKASSVNFFNSKNNNTIKLKTILNSDLIDINYQGNVDKIVIPTVAYFIRCYKDTDKLNYSKTSNNDSGSESTRILFTSTPHLVIPLDWESGTNNTGTTLNITTSTEEHLIDLTAYEDISNISSITISGPINNNDISIIRLMNKLEILDLTNASIITDTSTGFETKNINNIILTNVKLTANILGNYLFSGMNIKKVTLPNSILSIGEGCFANCKLLNTINNIPLTLQEIANSAFYGCIGLNKITLPNFSNQMFIRSGAFSECNNLTEIIIGSGSNLIISAQSFYNCNKIQLISFNNINSTPLLVTKSISNLVNTVVIIKNVTGDISSIITDTTRILRNTTNSYSYNKSEGVTLQSLLTKPTLSNWNTSTIKNIYSLTLSGYLYDADLQYLRDNSYGFKLFKNLRILDLSGVTNIISTGNNIVDNAFLESSLISIILPTNLSIKATIKSGAFESCKNLKSITIPKGINRIESQAFINCGSLLTIYITDRDTNTSYSHSDLAINYKAFYDCPIKLIICYDDILPLVVNNNIDTKLNNVQNIEIVIPNNTYQYVQSSTKLMWGESFIQMNTNLSLPFTFKKQCIPPYFNNLETLININSFWTNESIRAYLPVSPLSADSLIPNGGLWLAEVYRDDITSATRFGGTSLEVLESNTWIPAGPMRTILNGAVIEFLLGDTYIQRYDCMKTHPSNKDDMQTMAETLSFLCETRVNLDARYDTNRGKTGNLLPSPSNFNLMNSVYNQKNNYFNYRTLDYSKFNMDTFPNTFTWTKTKIAGELIDAWTNITMASTLDANGDYGSLKAFKIYNNEIYGFQDNAFFNVIFNSRVMIPTSDNAGIELTNNYKVEGTRYVSTTAGTRNKWGIKETPNGLYFIDDVSKSINVFNGKLNNLTDTLGFHSWVVDSIKDTTSWTPYAYNNFTTHYDCIDNNVYFVNDKHCLCYNETLGTFTSFFSYEGIPFMFNVWDNFIAVGKYLQTSETIDNVEVVTKSFNLWDLNKGDYNVFFGEHRPYYTLIIMNDEPRMDKIFNTLDFRSDTWTIEDSKRVPAIPSNICGFDLLEALNEYLYGKTNLTSEGRNTRDAVRRFRVWRTNIPRNNSQLGSTYKERMDRMRNTWLYVKLYSDGLNTNETVLHDLVVHYTV